GRFLIFLRPGEYVQTAKKGVQSFSFIDLKEYESAIGNGKLPIFRAHFVVDGPVNALRVEKGVLMAESESKQHSTTVSTALPIEAFDEYAKSFKTIANVNANLLEPSTFEDSAPIVQDLAGFFGGLKEEGAFASPA